MSSTSQPQSNAPKNSSETLMISGLTVILQELPEAGPIISTLILLVRTYFMSEEVMAL